MLKVLKVLQLAVLFLGLAFFFALAGLAYYSSSPAIDPSEHTTTTQTADNTPQEKEHSFRGLINFLFPDAISIFTFWLVVATILLGIIAYVQIDFLRRAEIISAQSAKAAKDSSDTAKNALVAANRPWVKAEIQVGGPLLYNVNGANFIIRYVLKNIGHSPATNIFVNPRVIAPAIGVDSLFDLRGELMKTIVAQKAQAGNPFGFALFPDEIAVQNVTVSIPQDELKRITQKVEFIMPTILGTISYRMGFDTDVHQTGFLFEVRRSDKPRAVSAEKNRAPSGIFPDEGDIPADEIRLVGSILDGGYAD